MKILLGFISLLFLVGCGATKTELESFPHEFVEEIIVENIEVEEITFENSTSIVTWESF